MASPIISLRIGVTPEVPGGSEVELMAEALNGYLVDLIGHMLDCHNKQDYEAAAAFKRDIETVGDLQFQLIRLLASELDSYHLSKEREFDWKSDREQRTERYISNYIKAYGSNRSQKGGSDA
jgi:hypothetical protein